MMSLTGGEQKTIAQYNPDADNGQTNGWQKLGNLITKGYKHDVISSKGAFLIIGHGHNHYTVSKSFLHGLTS